MKMKRFLQVGLTAVLILAAVQGASSSVLGEEVLKEQQFEENDMEPFVKPSVATTTAKQRGARAVIYLPEAQVTAIKKLQKDYKESVSLPTESKFTQDPVLENGVYSLGIFKPAIQESVAKQTNFYRELAGLQPVPLTQENIDFAQHGAIGMASLRRQTHGLASLTKPADMPQSFWETAGKSASGSNIHSSYKQESLNSHLDGYITDYGVGNTSVGHRTGVLGLQAISIGSGYAQAPGPELTTSANYYTATYVKSDYPGIPKRYANDFVTQWPTKDYFPLQMYNRGNPYMTDYYKNSTNPDISKKYEKNMRWSVYFNDKTYKIGNSPEVEILNQTTGVRTTVVTDSNGGEINGFNATPGYYAAGGYASLVFRPNNDFSVEANTKYTITVKGILKNGVPTTYTYSTHIVDMDATYEDGTVPVQSISISPKTITIGRTEEYQLTALVTPTTATNQAVKWSSSNDSVVRVDDTGKITGVAPGQATITAVSVDGEHKSVAQIKIEDKYIPVTSITIENKKENLVVQEGIPTTVSAKAYPESASNTALVWSSADPTIASVDQTGKITANTFGRTEITVHAADNTSVKQTFLVITDDHSDSPTGATPMTMGKPVNGRYDIGRDEKLAGISSSGEYDYFYFKAPQAGTYKFTGSATQPNGREDWFGYGYYTDKRGKWTGVSYFSSFHSVTLEKDEELWLYIKGQAIVDPEKPSQYIVDSKVGTTYFVMIDLQANYAYGQLSITDSNDRLIDSKLTMSNGQTATLKGNITNANILNPFYYDVRWRSSNKNIAEVNYVTGEIKTKAPGSVVITAENAYGIFIESMISKSITLTVQ